MRRRLLTILLFCSVVTTVGYSQGLADRVTAEYKSWREKLTSAKTFLVIPQDKYVPGDTIFLTAFFLTEDGAYVSGWQILRVAIIDSNGQTVHRQLVSTNNGVGANQIILPSTLREGNYLIVAYNDYMKSFDQSFYFRREIKVVRQNSIEANVAAMSPIVAAEGGHLVQGISNRVVIVAHDSSTRTATISTFGREVATATLDRFGTGSVSFVPKRGEEYVVTTNGKQVKLPFVEDDGLSLQLNTPGADSSLSVSISLPLTSKWRQGELVAALTVNGQLYFTAAFRLGGRKTVAVQFPRKDLPAGLALLSIIGDDGSMLASRHFYVASKQLNCNIELASTTVVANAPITSEISLTDANGRPVEGVFTVTAVNDNLFSERKPAFPTDINIVSELGALRAGDRSTEWLTALDNYLATQPGNIQWPTIMSENEPALKGPPKFVSVFGHAFFADTNQPIPDSSTVAGYMTKNRFAFEFKSGKNGELDLAFITLDGKDEMYYFIESEGKELDNVKIRWSFDSLEFRASPWKSSGKTDKYASFMSTRNAIDRSFTAFTKKTTATASTTFDSSLEDDLNHTGLTINVQEYRVFPDMPELMREIIPRLYYRKNGRREIVRVVFSDAYIQAESSPLYIIDGVITRSTPVFLSLNPAEIITVKVIHDPAELSRFQPIAKNGVVIVKTNKGNGAKNAVKYSTPIDGLNTVIPFRMPVQQPTGTRRKPDFRSTVYWNPDVRTDQNGKATVSFFATDDIGKLKLIVRGLAGGQYFEAEKVVKVRAIK